MGCWDGVDKREQSPRGSRFVGDGKEKPEGGRRQI